MRNSFIRSLGLLAGASPIAIALLAAPAIAQQAERTFSIPAGQLTSTLKEFSQQSGMAVEVKPGIADGKRSTAVSGPDLPVVALNKLLSGTGLVAQPRPEGGYVLVAASSADYETVMVSARRDPAETNYNVNASTTSDRFGGTLRDLPQSTNVISSKVLEDQQAQSVNEAVQNIAVASVNFANAGGLTGFNVRGFPVVPLSNGLENPASFTGSVDSIERVEVLQGPSAVLAGPFSEGGTVNVVTKKPSADRLFNVNGQFASFGDNKGMLDMSDALTDDKALSGRLVASAQEINKNFGGYDGGHTYMVAPTLRYKTDHIDAIVGYSWTSQNMPVSPYTMLDPSSGKPIVRPAVSIGPADQGINVHDSRYYYDVTAEVTPWLSAVSRGAYEDVSIGLKYFQLYGLDPLQGAPYVFGSQTADKQSGATFTDDTYVRAKFPLGPVTDTFVLGANAVHMLTDQYYANQSYFYGPAEFGADAPSFSLQSTGNTYLPASYTYYKAYNINYWTLGGYFQELLEYGPFHLAISGRYNTASSVLKYATGSHKQSRQSVHEFTPAYGAVYDVNDAVSVYINYMEGFYPNYDLRTFSGDSIPNNQTTNTEAGVKWDIVPDKLTLNTSLYRLTQSNLAISDPAHSGYYLSIPGERAEGFQAEVTGQVMPEWNLIASVSDAGFKVLHPNSYATNVVAEPNLRYSLYTTYTLQSGQLQGLGLGIGVFGSTGSYAAQYASFKNSSGTAYVPRISGGALVNTNLFYSIDQYQFNFGIKNLFDTRLYGVAYSSTFVPEVPSRTFVGTIRYHLD
jgi:iron complex outermembrane recepter protein